MENVGILRTYTCKYHIYSAKSNISDILKYFFSMEAILDLPNLIQIFFMKLPVFMYVTTNSKIL